MKLVDKKKIRSTIRPLELYSIRDFEPNTRLRQLLGISRLLDIRYCASDRLTIVSIFGPRTVTVTGSGASASEIECG